MTSEQENIYEILEVFAQLCEEHGLKYYLAGGTLLGAVRHKGFIPWDDDVDIIMPVSDYERFLSLAAQLPEGLELQSEDTEVCYPFYFAKLCNVKVPFESNTPCGPKGIYIDLFPIVPSCAPGRRAELYFNIISVIGYVLQVKLGWARYEPYKKAYARLCFSLLRAMPGKLLKGLRRFLIRSLSAEGTDYCFSPGGGHKGLVEFYPKRWFETQVMLPFEKESFCAPVGWDNYLKQLYGEYMILPDEEYRNSQHKVGAAGERDLNYVE